MFQSLRPTVVVPPPNSLPPVPEDDDDEMQEAREVKPSVRASPSDDFPPLPISSLGPQLIPGETDEDSDLVLDEALWIQFTHDHKVCSNTGSFTVPRDIEDRPISRHTVRSAEASNNFLCCAHTRDSATRTTLSLCHGLNDDDRAMLTLYTERQESLKASATQQQGSDATRKKSIYKASPTHRSP